MVRVTGMVRVTVMVRVGTRIRVTTEFNIRIRPRLGGGVAGSVLVATSGSVHSTA